MEELEQELDKIVAKFNEQVVEVNKLVDETYENLDEMTKNFNKKVDELTQKVDEVYEKIKQKPVKTKTGRVPKGEVYWLITADREFPIEKEIEGNYIEDDYFYDVGNYFRTEEEAEQALEKIKIYNKLKRFAEENNTRKIDWTDYSTMKYSIAYEVDEKKLYAFSTNTNSFERIYFTSREIAEKAIEEIGEENIIKLFD